MSIPDWGVTPFAADQNRETISQKIGRFNAINVRATERASARYVDVSAISREAASDWSLLARDGLHPSAKMYRRWAEQALPEARAAMNRIAHSK